MHTSPRRITPPPGNAELDQNKDNISKLSPVASRRNWEEIIKTRRLGQVAANFARLTVTASPSLTIVNPVKPYTIEIKGFIRLKNANGK